MVICEMCGTSVSRRKRGIRDHEDKMVCEKCYNKICDSEYNGMAELILKGE